MKIKLLLLLIIFICSGGTACADPSGGEGSVVKCFDGDTFKLADRRIIRLAGIDAPEMPHGSSIAQYYSRKSKKILETLLKGEKIQISFPGVKIKDNYGRYIAEVKRSEEEPSINEQLVECGAAFFYPHMDLSPDFQERLSRLQSEAIQERRGMWQYLLSHPVANLRYVGNRETLRFFPESCDAAHQIKPRNREYFGTLMDAFLAGYAPARVCPFWPQDTVRDW